MKTTPTIIICAILSLSIGIAAATPLLVSELNFKPYPGLPEGPKADTSISVIYANFSTRPGNTIKNPIGGVSEVTTTMLDYEIILNVTNLSDFGNQITRLSLTAAQDIYATPASVGYIALIAKSNPANGGVSGGGGSKITTSDDFARGTRWNEWSQYNDGQLRAGGSGLVTGVWLDEEWINVTWIPGTEYPQWPAPSDGWFSTNGSLNSQFYGDTWPTLKTIPTLPQNATTEGTWVEGVPLLEMHNITTESGMGITTDISTSTAIFINGSWVDVTGRVKTAHEQLYVRATNAIATEIHYFGDEPVFETIQARDEIDIELIPGTYAYMPFRTFTKSGEGEFNDYWAPHESRLILLKGTREVLPNWGLDSLETGKIWLLAEQFNHVQDSAINNTEVYTYSDGHWLNQVTLHKTTNGYLYSTLGDQTFVTDRFGVEVFLKQRS